MADDEARSFNWLEFHELAEELAKRDDEASLRTAVSRSYYAVFHLSQLVLEHHDPEYSIHRSRDSHKTVWDKLGGLGQRQAKNAVRRGRSLLRERKAADYEPDAGDWPKRAQSAISHAGAALRGLVDMLPDS